MKDSEYWLAGAAGISTLLVAWFAGRWLKLTGADLWIMRGGIAALGFFVIGALLWPRIRAGSDKSKGAAGKNAPDKSVMSIGDLPAESFVREAESNFGRKLSDVPVVFVLDPDRSATESLVENAGLEVEQVARVAGGIAWTAAETVFLEIKPQLYEDDGTWARLLASLKAPRLSSGFRRGPQAPRAVVLTIATSPFAQPDSAGTVRELAQALRSRLREISRPLGMSVPVYVVFTGVQNVPQFEFFAAQLGKDALSEPFGVTFETDTASGTTGVWADRQSNRIRRGFQRLFEILSARKLDVLIAEPSDDRRQRAYLFPREFMKLGMLGPISDFLLELSRPHQLGASPYLRGFYFTGVRESRKVSVADDSAPRTARRAIEDQSLTRALQESTQSPQVAGKTQPPRSRMEWVFAQRLFTDVLLADIRNLRSTFVSSDVSLWRRVALGLVVGLLVIVGALLTRSYFGNRDLQNRAEEYAASLPVQRRPDGQVPLTQLRALESMRLLLMDLRRFKDSGPPWRLGLGLYVGNDLYAALRKAYFDRFGPLLLAPVQEAIGNHLVALPASPDTPNVFDPAYEALKAYLINRSQHNKSTREFLSPALRKWWSAFGQNGEPERRRIIQAQFDFYADELRTDPPYPALDDDRPVMEGRRFIQDRFGGVDRIYSLMLATAGKDNPPVNFAKQYPGVEDIVVNTPEIPGAFTRAGWLTMQSMLKNPGRWFQSEDWVVAMPQVDVSKVSAELPVRYQTDYTRQWNEFLQQTRIVTCRARTTADAAKRLTALASPQSPILGLFCVAAQNTSIDAPEIRNAFQPVHAVVPPECSRQLTGEANDEYLRALFGVSERLQDPAIAVQGADARSAVAPQVAMARAAAHNLETKFQLDQQWQVHKSVSRLLSEPIAGVESCTPGVQVAGVCAELRPIKNRYPFDARSTTDAPVEEVDRFFNPKTGTIWMYQQQALASLINERNGQFFVNPLAARPVRPEFLTFINRAARIRDTFYKSGAPGPQAMFWVRIAPSPGIVSVTLRVGRTTHNYANGQSEAQQFTWSPSDGGAELQVQGAGEISFPGRRFEGPWALFHLMDEMRIAGGTDNQFAMEWIIRESLSKQAVEYQGKPLTIRLDISGDIGYLLRPENRAKLECVQNVTQ